MAPLRSLGNPDISPFDDVFCATGKPYNIEYPEPVYWYGDRGVFMGGYSGNTNKIDYITITSTGNASDFGDLSQARKRLGSCSNAHGGL